MAIYKSVKESSTRRLTEIQGGLTLDGGNTPKPDRLIGSSELAPLGAQEPHKLSHRSV